MFSKRLKAVLFSQRFKTVVFYFYLLMPLIGMVRESIVYLCSGSGFSCPSQAWLSHPIYLQIAEPPVRWTLFALIAIGLSFPKKLRFYSYLLLCAFYVAFLLLAMEIHRHLDWLFPYSR